MELHFLEDPSPLVIDLRETEHIDSYGVGVLERSRLRHSLLSLVGRPRDYEHLPFSSRETLDTLRPARGIAEAMTSYGEPSGLRRRGEARRRHVRFPVQLPVEIFLGTLCTSATLHDLSVGGTRIGRLPGQWLREIESFEETPAISIHGLEQDPLGMEIASRYGSPVLLSRPVHVLPDQRRLGVAFSPSPPGGGA